MQTLGIVDIVWRGQKIPVEKGAKFRVGGIKQNAVTSGRRVAYDNAARGAVHQQVWMIDGVMELTVGGTRWQLEAGDCLAMTLDEPIVYRNPGSRSARYLVALATVAAPAAMPLRRST